MTDLDPRTAPWRAIALHALLRRQLEQLADDWELAERYRPCPDGPCDQCGGTGDLASDYSRGSADAYHEAAATLRDLLEGPR